MPTINATQQFGLTVVETGTAAEVPSAGDRTINHNQFNSRVRLNASSTPPGTMTYAAEGTGTVTLDLTALVCSVFGTKDATGLKLQSLLLNNLSTTDNVDIGDAGANPYVINNGNNIRVPPGGKLETYYADQLADVAAGAKGITITAGVAEDWQLVLVFG
jgi:hypothetical protein